MVRILTAVIVISFAAWLLWHDDSHKLPIRDIQQREDERIAEALPNGCAIHDLGSYRSLKNLVIVTCDGRPTTTTNENWISDKNAAATVTVGSSKKLDIEESPTATGVGQAAVAPDPFPVPKKVKTYQVRPDGSLTP